MHFSRFSVPETVGLTGILRSSILSRKRFTQPNIIMNDRELAQLTFAMRIFDHDVDISYSTRESAEIRNHMATLGVTTMSAESKTEPGGYYSYPQTLEQFHINDDRKAVEVERDLRKLGREPVWKDWDQSFDNLKRV